MAYFGYHRVSTKQQKLDRGVHEIEKFCSQNNYALEKIYLDKVTGADFNRPRYIVMKEDVLRPGDVLVIKEIDRLGRNKNEILKEIQYYSEHNIRLMILELPTTLMDYDSLGSDFGKMMFEAMNKFLIEIYSAQAQSETEKRAMRQREGIEAKKRRGESWGRSRLVDLDLFEKEYKKVESGILRACDVKRRYDLSNSTYYRYVDELKRKEKTI